MLRLGKIVILLVALEVATTNAGSLRYPLLAEGSCEGRCNQTGTVPDDCQCNTSCIRFNDCCPDYYTLCLGQNLGSCVGRCDQVGTDPGAPCQCNKPCADFGDCCPDYSDVCGPTDGITDPELEQLAEELLALDTVNNATAFIQVDLQGNSNGNPLLTVAPGAYAKTTIQKLKALHDNYVADVNVAESYSPEEQTEIDDFLNAVFDTPVMQRLQEFLVAKNLPSGRDSFFELWYGLYSRGNGGLGSSGFEHVFLAELKSGVSGFHNWEFWAVEEDGGRIDYNGYTDYIDMGSKGSIIEHTFAWQGQNKPISSMFIGTSPELELSLYTVCWHARKNAKCPISLDGNKVKIQTYTIGSSGQYVATSYPDLSG